MGIVGVIGGGKIIFIKLLLCLYDVNLGSIVIDGIKVFDMCLEDF